MNQFCSTNTAFTTTPLNNQKMWFLPLTMFKWCVHHLSLRRFFIFKCFLSVSLHSTSFSLSPSCKLKSSNPMCQQSLAMHICPCCVFISGYGLYSFAHHSSSCSHVYHLGVFIFIKDRVNERGGVVGSVKTFLKGRRN